MGIENTARGTQCIHFCSSTQHHSCEHCGEAVKIIASIEDPEVIEAILTPVGYASYPL